MVEDIEILSKGCIKKDNKVICNEQFKIMNESIINAMTDTGKEFNENLFEYKEKIDNFSEFMKSRGFANDIPKYNEGIGKYIREKLGGAGKGNREILSRMERMGCQINRKEKTPLMSEQEWVKARERAKEF